jgi:hypothetical protein
MRARVMLRREGGAHRQPYGLGHTATGDLYLTYRTVQNRRVAVMQLLGSDLGNWPNLYEPRLLALSTNRMKFVGFERFEERAWVLQEWDC